MVSHKPNENDLLYKDLISLLERNIVLYYISDNVFEYENNHVPVYMVDLNDYLKLNSNAIVDLVEKKYVPAEMSQESTFEGLATLLQGKFIVQHCSGVGKQDPAHNVLAMVIIYSMWCGWLSQAKANRGG